MSLQLLRGGIWACMRYLCLCVGFWDMDFHVWGIMFLLKVVLNMLMMNVKESMCFRCLLFSLSGHCEFLFFICSIASWT